MKNKPNSYGNRIKIKIASFAMAIIIFVLSMIASLYRSTFSEVAVEKAFNQSSYSEKVFVNAYQQVESLTIKNDLPETVFNRSITQEQIDVFVSVYKKLIKDKGAEGLMMEDLKVQLKENVINYAQKNKIEITEDIEKNIDKYVAEVVSICKSSVRNSFLERLLSFTSLFIKIALILVPLSLIIIFLCTWIIYNNSSKRHKFRILRYYATATGASGLVLVIVPIVLKLLNLDQKFVEMGIQYKFDAASSFLNLSFQNMIISGIALFIIQILLVATWLVLTNRKKQ